MLHYVHQLFANSACLLFGVGQVVFTWFYPNFFAKNKKQTGGKATKERAKNKY